MIAISLFLCTLQHLLEITTIQPRAFLEVQQEVAYDVLAHKPRTS